MKKEKSGPLIVKMKLLLEKMHLTQTVFPTSFFQNEIDVHGFLEAEFQNVATRCSYLYPVMLLFHHLDKKGYPVKKTADYYYALHKRWKKDLENHRAKNIIKVPLLDFASVWTSNETLKDESDTQLLRKTLQRFLLVLPRRGATLCDLQWGPMAKNKLEGKLITLSVFKTKKTYGTQIVEIKDTLLLALVKKLRERNLSNFVFPTSIRGKFRKSLVRDYTNILGKTAKDYRTAYFTHLYPFMKTEASVIDIATRNGTSAEQVRLSYKKNTETPIQESVAEIIFKAVKLINLNDSVH